MRAGTRMLAAALCLIFAAGCLSEPRNGGKPLRCAISVPSETGGSALRCGYTYEMLRRYAAADGLEAQIRLAGRRERVLDSLRHGALDVVAMPYADSLAADSTLVWMPSDSCGVWVFSVANEAEQDCARSWLKAFAEEAWHDSLKFRFMEPVSPYAADSSAWISPYDSLLRVYADTLGWDWRMLAALVYQESKFRIEARSPRGAFGLMQLVPDTARGFGCDDPFSPEENIKAGVKLLQALENRYRKTAANSDELARFAMASYNAGAARVQDCVNYARHMGYDVSRWENVARVIPDMKHDSIAALDTIKLGTFYGFETTSFVSKISRFYERYKKICP